MYERYVFFRDKMKLTDTDVSEATGIRRATFSDWKKDGRISLDNIVKIADYLECSVDELLGRQTCTKGA